MKKVLLTIVVLFVASVAFLALKAEIDQAKITAWNDGHEAGFEDGKYVREKETGSIPSAIAPHQCLSPKNPIEFIKMSDWARIPAPDGTVVLVFNSQYEVGKALVFIDYMYKANQMGRFDFCREIPLQLGDNDNSVTIGILFVADDGMIWYKPLPLDDDPVDPELKGG